MGPTKAASSCSGPRGRARVRRSVPGPHEAAARVARAAALKRGRPQVEDDENDPDWLADEAVVI